MKFKKNKIYIIAEVGVNHNGNIKIAKQLINVAKESGADYVKFQMYVPDELVTKACPSASYQIKNNNKDITQYNMLKKYYFNEKQLYILRKYCQKIRIKFVASVFDIKSLKIYKKFKTDFVKLPSSEIDNLFLLNELSKTKNTIIFSTGMSNFKEIHQAFKILKKNKHVIVPMYCVSSYPTKIEEFNFSKLNRLKSFSKYIGFSDHSITHESSIISAYNGVNFIERHITLRNDMAGPDHTSSLSPVEFKKFVLSVRNVEKLKFSRKNNYEASNKKFVRKFLVAKTNIKKGEKFSLLNVTAKRSKGFLNPFFFNFLKNKKSKHNYFVDQPIRFSEK